MKKKYVIILLFISLCLCLFFIQDSFAKYLTSASETANMNIARWKIIVNNKDIRDNSSSSAIISPVFLGNDNVASDIIAPGSEGYFDLIIDANAADVSFKYKIDITTDENSAVKDIIAVKYKINNGEEILFTGGNQTIEKSVLHSDNTDVINIRVYIKWNDGDGSEMDNIADTAATQNKVGAILKVNMNFTQLV
ncbi:MAG: hypothetical protein SOZ11_04885 [Bacilli bacterium]|nr:hypothetical protein [bacterium]MDY3934846.1 hypothetical protein [Bacilli bacterium]